MVTKPGWTVDTVAIAEVSIPDSSAQQKKGFTAEMVKYKWSGSNRFERIVLDGETYAGVREEIIAASQLSDCEIDFDLTFVTRIRKEK